MTEQMTYAGVGVDYNAMDPFKRACQMAGRETAGNIERLGFRELEASRGESAYLMDTPYDFLLAHVEEGLGTKNVAADAAAVLEEMVRIIDAIRNIVGADHLPESSFYNNVAQCTLAAIVNDLITVGALPLSAAMHLAVGSSDWFNNHRRCQDLVEGWKRACNLARCVWGGGETPTLPDVVMPEAAVLSGSAVGMVRPKSNLITPANIQPGDDILLFASSGIHANGLTMARKIAAKLKVQGGYMARLPDGRFYGEALLAPTIIYAPLIERCQKAGIRIHYAVNITGHGWRKLMRAPQPFSYIIETLPRQQPLFAFLQEHGPITNREAYGNLNMGAGFALFVSPKDTSLVHGVCDQYNAKVLANTLIMTRAGHIEASAEKRVFIVPKGIEFKGEELKVR